MCAPSAPKPSEIEKIPMRQPMLLPDGGDPLVRANQRRATRLSSSMMIFANRNGALGAPSVAAPLGVAAR